MKYTKYFGRMNKDRGLQRISHIQMARIMNIAYLEGRLRGIKESTSLFLQDKNTRRSEVLTYRVARQITDLTGNREPKDVLKEMCYLSERDEL